MKLFALIMLRGTLIMLLSSPLQNGTLATLGEWDKSCQELKEWAALCQLYAISISTPGLITLDDLSDILEAKFSLNEFLSEVNKFPLEGMDELLDRRLREPLKVAISNCEKLLNEVKHSGREYNKKYLETLVSMTSSIANGIDKEFNTFIMEVELELIKKVKWTSGNKEELEHTFSNLYELAKPKQSYCDPEKLKILETEFNSKIAGFAQQQPHIDGDGFIAFSHNFKLEWNQIDQMTRQLTSNDDKDTFRKRLDNLAEKAMKETAPLKAIITEKFDQLITKCQNSLGKLYKEEASKQRVAAALGMGPSKPVFFKVGGSNKSKHSKQNKQKEQKEEAKKKEIDAMKEFISDIGMFDGAAYKLLVRFELEELGKTDLCAKLKKAVAEDKQMVSTAYQVKDNEL